MFNLDRICFTVANNAQPAFAIVLAAAMLCAIFKVRGTRRFVMWLVPAAVVSGAMYGIGRWYSYYIDHTLFPADLSGPVYIPIVAGLQLVTVVGVFLAFIMVEFAIGQLSNTSITVYSRVFFFMAGLCTVFWMMTVSLDHAIGTAIVSGMEQLSNALDPMWGYMAIVACYFSAMVILIGVIGLVIIMIKKVRDRRKPLLQDRIGVL